MFRVVWDADGSRHETTLRGTMARVVFDGKVGAGKDKRRIRETRGGTVGKIDVSRSGEGSPS